jgi:hypothetical protein
VKANGEASSRGFSIFQFKKKIVFSHKKNNKSVEKRQHDEFRIKKKRKVHSDEAAAPTSVGKDQQQKTGQKEVR